VLCFLEAFEVYLCDSSSGGNQGRGRVPLESGGQEAYMETNPSGECVSMYVARPPHCSVNKDKLVQA